MTGRALLCGRHLILHPDYFQITCNEWTERTVPIKSVISAEALDSRKGVLYLRNGNYSWLGHDQSLEDEDECEWSGGLEEVTCKRNTTAAKFRYRKLACMLAVRASSSLNAELLRADRVAESHGPNSVQGL